MILGFSGTRRGTTPEQHAALRELLAGLHYPIAAAHHGDCVGADAEFHALIRELHPSARIVIHPPTVATMRANCQGDETLSPLDYLVRNRAIVAACQELIACPAEMENVQRSGTWSTIRFAGGAKPCRIVFPDGSVLRWER